MTSVLGERGLVRSQVEGLDVWERDSTEGHDENRGMLAGSWEGGGIGRKESPPIGRKGCMCVCMYVCPSRSKNSEAMF